MKALPMLFAIAFTLMSCDVLGAGEVDVESIYISEDNFRFGQYSGLYEGGVHVNGGFNWHSDIDDRYLQLEAKDLGLRSREVSFRLQTVSSLDVSASYSE